MPRAENCAILTYRICCLYRLLHTYLDYISAVNMPFFQRFGRKDANLDSHCRDDDQARAVYNERVSHMRKLEYHMLKGVLAYGPPYMSC